MTRRRGRKGDGQSVERLLRIMARLRHPARGCPWDQKQTFATIAPYTVEEAYEVAQAITDGDLAALREELGDLLFQVVYHARMAEEVGAFDFHDVARAVSDKMVRRHPHVFGKEALRSEAAHHKAWEDHKAAERAATGAAGLLDDIPVALPALRRAEKLQKRAARVGFDWSKRHRLRILDKIEEEVSELRQALRERRPAAVAAETGDLLFAMVNLARHLGVDAETALSRTNAKFVQRFRFIERRLAAKGIDLREASLAQMEALWQAAKVAERPKRPRLQRKSVSRRTRQVSRSGAANRGPRHGSSSTR